MIPYHLRQAARSFVRHLAMSLSAATAVSVTLTLLALFLVLAGNVSLFAGNIESGLQIHVVLNADVDSEEEIREAGETLKGIDNVAVATLSDKDEELELMIREKGEAFAMYRGEENPLSNAFFITVEDPDRIEETTQTITELSFVSDAVYGGTSVSSLISLLNTVRQGGMIFVILPRALVSLRRIGEVLNTEAKITDGTLTAAPEGSPVGTVEFRNVSFKYPDASEYVLHDMSFKAERGQTVAFIGSTGSGKSTAINLVPRFYDATEGEVLVDGVNVKDYTLAALHDKIGYVPQRAVMFSGTVESNVTYGEKAGLDYSEEAVKDAVRIAQGQGFVEEKEDGYKAHVAQGGTNFSGGQKQRLAIARAVYRRPEIYIFDDSFSALDYKTDKQLRTALREETGGATSLIVAQRIGTIRDADLIVVLDEGKVVGKGTHDELMQNCDVYREIAYSQLSEEELAGMHGEVSKNG